MGQERKNGGGGGGGDRAADEEGTQLKLQELRGRGGDF